MLAMYIALCLMSKQLKRVPTRVEHARVVAVVTEVFASLRRSQPSCPKRALEQLRSNARVREVLDVATDVRTMSSPHTFIDFDELLRTLKTEKAIVCPSLGAITSFGGKLVLSTEAKQKKTNQRKLKRLFESTQAVSVITFEA